MTPARATSPLLDFAGSTVVVHVFPDDDRLLRDVRRSALAMAADAADEESLRHAVEAGLRPWYPRVTITCRQELARLDQGEHVWYVLRDGRVRRPQEWIDRLYSALGAARDTSDRTSEALRRADAALATASAPRSASARAARAATHDDPAPVEQPELEAGTMEPR